MRNKYLKRAHITEIKFRKILRLFCIDLTAVQIAELPNVKKSVLDRFLQLIRARIYEIAERESCFGSGEIEIDESCYT